MLLSGIHKILKDTGSPIGAFGDDELGSWVVTNTQGMTSKERETFLLRKYRDQLKNAQPPSKDKPRSARVAVLDPLKDRTKYHLVYLTRHELGIKVFMEASEKVEIVQRIVRSRAKQDRRLEKTGQFDIFAGREEITADDGRIDLEEVKNIG